MPDWLYLLPDDAIIALAVAVVVGATFASRVLGHYLLRVRVSADRGGPVSEGYRMVVSLTALVLAFSLVQAQTDLREVQAELRREANALVELDRALRHLDTAGATALRGALGQYGRAVLEDEWPRLADGRGRSPLASALFAGLLRAAPAVADRTASQDEVVRKLERLSELREARVTSATLRLSPAFWRAALALVLVSILLAAAMPWTGPYLFSLLLMSAALAVLLALVAIVAVPFRGESAVRPTEQRQAVEALQAPP